MPRNGVAMICRVGATTITTLSNHAYWPSGSSLRSSLVPVNRSVAQQNCLWVTIRVTHVKRLLAQGLTDKTCDSVTSWTSSRKWDVSNNHTH